MAVVQGELTPTEGTAIATLVDGVRKAVETHDLECRLTALEMNTTQGSISPAATQNGPPMAS